MDSALLDTDIFSEVLRGRNLMVVKRAPAYREAFGHYTVSSATMMEVLSGLHRVATHPQLLRATTALADAEVLSFYRDMAQLAGAMHGDLLRSGKGIGIMDCIIAATAMGSGFTLVTGNTEHYRRIQEIGYDLKLENWRE